MGGKNRRKAAAKSGGKASSSGDAVYYHATTALAAYPIIRHGFKILPERSSVGARGRGVYLAEKVEDTHYFHGLIIACRLASGVRVAWIDGRYDRKVIASLARKFGRWILSGASGWRAFPSRKRLTRRELVHLLNYYESRRSIPFGGKKDDRYMNILRGLSRLNEHVRRHQIHAVGFRSENRSDSEELIVFNPSHVTPIAVHEVRRYQGAPGAIESVALGPEVAYADLGFRFLIEAEEDAEFERHIREASGRCG